MMGRFPRDIEWLFGFGMPKCGTTTLSQLLALSAELSLHNAKEPNDFLSDNYTDLPKLSGYKRTQETRYFVDFSTQYGTKSNRDRFIGNLRNSGLIGKSKVVIALRDPEALARSYHRHLQSRTRLSETEINRRISQALDFEGAIECLDRNFGRGQVFIVKFEDLLSLEAQKRTIDSIFDWLSIQPVPIEGLVSGNIADSARRYPFWLDRLMRRVREIGIIRSVPSSVRSRISGVLTQPAPHYKSIFEPRESLDPQLLDSSYRMYSQLSTGRM